ncbi:hypothetical protein DL98DRAFT_531316 [Cadophora sp. DSE1049]|nr:hypothetical protein DL98DRAFT_531316 [Cadophora sp. DSE1049]
METSIRVQPTPICSSRAVLAVPGLVLQKSVQKRGCRWCRANDSANWCLLLRTDEARDLPLVNEWGKRSTYRQALLIRTIPQPDILVLERHIIRLFGSKPTNVSSSGRQDTGYKSQDSKRQAAEKLETPVLPSSVSNSPGTAQPTFPGHNSSDQL